MVGNTFRLKDGTMAILCENDQRSIVLIPARAEVVVVGGDIDGFLSIRYHGKLLFMLSEDLRSAGGEAFGQSA
jgi:hypothetical protein